MKSNRKKKGEKGYLAEHKKVTVFRTVLLFALSLAVFLIGYFSTGSNQNLLTIVAVLGCLPASRSAVNMIVTLRYHGINDADYRKIREHEGQCACLADLVFTSYEKNYEIHHMAYADNCLIGYTANEKCDAKACEKHLHGMCVQNNLGDVSIKIFKEMPKYLNRLDQIQRLPEYTQKEQTAAETKTAEVLSLMRAISL